MLSCYSNIKVFEQESVLTVPNRWELPGAQALLSTFTLNLKHQIVLAHVGLELMSCELSLGELEIPSPDTLQEVGESPVFILR